MSKSRKGTNVESFNENDRRQIGEIGESIRELIKEVRELKQELKETKAELKTVKIENERLKQAVNLQVFKLDELDQYGRRENIRIHGVPESFDTKDDGESVVLNIANELNIKIKTEDIQRAHRLGRIRPNASKPRPVIVRFISYKMRNEFLYSKSTLKNSEEFSQAFITEDLTPLRLQLFNYVKRELKDDFVMCHTFNGTVRMKKLARKAGKLIRNDEKDTGVGNWILISNPDDFFQHHIDIDFNKLNYAPLEFNVKYVDEDVESE